MSARLPDGFTVRLADDTVVLGGGTVLVGGSPLTSLRIADASRRFRGRRDLTVTDRVSACIADRLLATNLALPDLASVPHPQSGDLTVVIPVRDGADQLDRCLTSLTGLACIVVDDASRDWKAVAAATGRHGATLVRLDNNIGPAGARNAGLSRVRTPYVAFVDADIEVRARDLLELLRHFADPAVALVGPRVVGRTHRARPRWFERYEARDSSLTLGRRAASVRPGAAVAWLPSACLVGRVSSLGDGFDASMRVGEDVDLVWRLTDSGQRVRYEPCIQARHDTRPTVRAWLARKTFYGSGSAALAARHGSHVAPAVLSPSLAFAGAAILGRHRLAIPMTAIAIWRGSRAVTLILPSEPSASSFAARIAARGVGWTLRQEAALILRHWWPLTVVGMCSSGLVRRVVLSAMVIDLATVIRQTDDLPYRDAAAHFAARRFDDLAYGAGLWSGAIRRRDWTALMPRWVSRPD